MAPLLRARLTCFYCGRGSGQKKKSGLRKWRCEHCEAENFLDENGDIADPPPAFSNTNENARFASSIKRPESPIFDKAPDSIFCGTCLKNQHLFNESLAQYYPLINGERYQDYDDAFPEYRAKLEERYPQCCADCEPRVRQRLKDTNYAAKTDNLRRIMERTNRGDRESTQRLSWKSLLVSFGGVLWTLSWAWQIMWDLVVSSGLSPDLQQPSHSRSASIQLIARRFTKLPVLSKLVPFLSSAAAYSLVLGAVSLWWNPCMKERILRKGARVIGLYEFYKLQFIGLVLRFAAWYCISHLDFHVESERSLHAFMLIFSIPCIYRSLRMVDVDYNPKVVYKEDPVSLLPQPSSQRDANKSQAKSNGNVQIQSQPRFPIESLAQKPLPPYQPPTPPESLLEMDWSPCQAALPAPKPYHPLPPPLKETPPRAGFRGHLPPDVVSPAHRVRNPPNQPTFRKASEATKLSFFNRHDDSIHQDQDLVSESPETSPAKTVASNYSPTFKNARFFPPGEDKDETGLESILENAFTISEPTEVREHRRQQVEIQQQRQRQRQQALLPTALHILFTISLLGFSYIMLYSILPEPFANTLARFPPELIQLFALGPPIMLAFYSLVSASLKAIPILISISECAASALLTAAVFQQIEGEEQMLEMIGKSAIVGIGMLEVGRRSWTYLSSSID